MLPRQHSMDSETSSDSWLVIQKGEEFPEQSNDEVDIESSLDSGHWDSDNEESEDSPYNGEVENDTDSVEDYEASPESDDEAGGDCEIVDENEALQMSCSRYFIAAEKIHKSFDLLDAECCTDLTKLIFLPPTVSISRDTARAIILSFATVLAAIFFLRGAGFTSTRSEQSLDEVFASGQQSRKDLWKASVPNSYYGEFFNSSKSPSGLLQCKRWQKFTRSFTRSSVPTYSTPQPLKTSSSSAYAANSTSFLQFDGDGFLFVVRPVATIARISISRFPKRALNVCRQNGNRKAYWTRKQVDFGVKSSHMPFENNDNSDRSNIRIHDASFSSPRPSSSPSPLMVASISIAKAAKADVDVCNQNIERKKVPSFPRTISMTGNRFLHKKMTDSHLSSIIHKTSTSNTVKKEYNVFSSSNRSSYHKKRLVLPCIPIHRPCVEHNNTIKRRKVPNFVARKAAGQLMPYKQRLIPPSQPIVHMPCMDENDSVRCWKSIQYHIEPMLLRGSTQKLFDDWFHR